MRDGEGRCDAAKDADADADGGPSKLGGERRASSKRGTRMG